MTDGDFLAGHSLYDHADLDRLSLAAPLLGATGWIDGLARLVSIDCSGQPSSCFHAYADLLQDMFAPLGFSFRRLPGPLEGSGPGKTGSGETAVGMVAARRTGRRVCTIYFRMNSMPAGEGWTRPPFALTRQSSRLYGRGTTEMKGAIAAVWAALRAADAVGLGLSYDPVLIFCADRDDGHHVALRRMAAEGLVEGHLMCLDGPATPRIWSGSLGSIHLSVSVEGLEPPEGSMAVVNPVEAMAPLMARLLRLKQEIESRAGEAGQEEPPAALAVTSIHGGTPGAEWPASCNLLLSRSYTAREDFRSVLGELQAAVHEGCVNAGHLNVQTVLSGHCAPVQNPDRGPNWPRWQEALNWGFGYPMGRFRRLGSREGSPLGFVQQAGVQELLLGGLRRAACTPTGPDEFTTIEDVEALARSVLAYLAEVPEIPTY
ncbi:M20/M25/M40 family metallo-hydrolase [Pseudoroseomonas ludipueritiae]|uniref:M20/M25/M40 family metallo-hydrolase n=1 Tax=Pseudoroseomonas ludipueritiae TaxID=198093 RepID=A0ABR7R0U9_9PROT|nr:M20/M25/M40 family metallo-hydrolase [Pseudoroseomonas ludipueritiae]MBC9175364.1 M20/M25/M40 family metallo-hydrolase [Pseudoroseomonas ludipueritiae]